MSTAAAKSLSPRAVDPVLLAAACVIVSVGLIMVSSASVSIAERTIGDNWHYLNRHAVALVIGIAGAAAMSLIPTQTWYRLRLVLLAAALGLLALVLVSGVGYSVNGAQRWIRVSGFSFQPSELARLGILIFVSGYVVQHRDKLVSSFMGFATPMFVVAFACFLLLLEPDFGAAVVLAVTCLGILFVGGARIRDFFVLGTASAGVLAVAALTSPYRVARLTAFLDPWADPFNSGFQLTQSLIAIGRGDWFGVGLGASVQKLFYLPEAHTDFVFAVIAEETGFVGATAIVVLFAVLVGRGFQLAHRADVYGLKFQACLAFGISLWLGLQAFINLGVNAGVLPTKGLTLPLLSYGRTSLIVSLAAIGLLLRIHYEVSQSAPQGRARRGRR